MANFIFPTGTLDDDRGMLLEVYLPLSFYYAYT